MVRRRSSRTKAPEAPADERSNGEAAPMGASIRVVANRTGIGAATLRVWERRYEFPRPSRRPGGSRVYSEADIARLHVITRALAAGFRPSEVVSLALDALAKLVDASVADAPQSPAGPPRSVAVAAVASGVGGASGGPTPGVDTIIEALLGDDVNALRALLRKAAVAMGPRTFVTELAHPLVTRVGEMWAAGLLAVRHEHLTSASLTAQLHLVLGALDDGDRSPSVLLATLPGEPHILPLDMVAVYLAASLAAPHVLGGDSPPEQIAQAAEALGVDVVGISISPVADRRATTRALKHLVGTLPSHIELWLGGAGANGHVRSAPSARLVRSWSELDSALAAWRSGDA